LYQGDIGKYGPETIRLFTPPLAAGPKAGVTVTADEAFGADPRQTLDVYQPQGANNLPVVVFVHGGALTSGNKNENRVHNDCATPLAAGATRCAVTLIETRDQIARAMHPHVKLQPAVAPEDS